MTRAGKDRGQTRRAAIVAASAAAHVVVLVLLGLTTPRPPTVWRNDVVVAPVEIWTPPPAVTASHRPRSMAAASTVKPRQPRLVAPPAISPLPLAPATALQHPAPVPAVGAGDHPAPLPAPAHGDLRRALRGSTVGCANRDAVGLTLREREGCDGAYARGREDAPFIEPPMEAGKRAAYDAEAARKARIRKRKEAPPPAGIDLQNNAGGTRTNGIGILGY